jgi:uncharacterized protein (DUF362 family)
MYEFWFRNTYKNLIVQKALTRFVRPGDRSGSNPKSVKEGERVLIKILLEPSDRSDKGPVFDEYTTKAVVTSAAVKKIRELKAADFVGASPDASSPEAVVHHLGLIYNKHFTLDDMVTAYCIQYEQDERRGG